MFKKITLLLSTGVISSSSIIATVACAKPLTDEQQEIKNTLTSQSTINLLEKTWTDKLMNDFFQSDSDKWKEYSATSDHVKDAPTMKWTQNDWTIVHNDEFYDDKTGINRSELVKLSFIQDAFKLVMQNNIVDNSEYLQSLMNFLRAEPEFDAKYNAEDKGDDFLIGEYSNFNTLGFNLLYREFDPDPTKALNWYDRTFTSIDSANPLVIKLTKPNSSNEEANLSFTDKNKALEWLMDILFRVNSIDVSNTIFRMILAQKYFALSRDEWEPVFGEKYRKDNGLSIDDGFTYLDKSIVETHDFPLVKYGLDNKPFMSWKIDSSEFWSTDTPIQDYAKAFGTNYDGAEHHLIYGFTNTDGDQLVRHWNTDIDKDIAAGGDLSTPTFQNFTNFQSLYTYGREKDNNEYVTADKFLNQFAKPSFMGAKKEYYIGYQGVNSRSSAGNKKLSFTTSKLKLNTTADYLNGFVVENDIVNRGDNSDRENIKIFKDDNSNAIYLEKVISMLPTYDTLSNKADDAASKLNRFTYDKQEGWSDTDTEDETKASNWWNDKQLLAWQFYLMSPSKIWENIMEYETNENGGNWKIDIYSKYVFDLYDNMGLKYVQYNADTPSTN